jgi:membrane protein DedA with SNARE-associated domain
MHLLGSLIDILHRGGPWLGPALGCTTLVASLTLLGLFIPLTAILVACGAASGGQLLGPTVVARYTGPPTLAPFMAGWSLLPRARFMAANAAASLTWPPIVVAVGSIGAWLATQ